MAFEPCRKCGAPLAAAANFCMKCGAALPGRRESSSSAGALLQGKKVNTPLSGLDLRVRLEDLALLVDQVRDRVENWFSKIERDVIARRVFTSVNNLRHKLMRYIRHYNQTATNGCASMYGRSRRSRSSSDAAAASSPRAVSSDVVQSPFPALCLVSCSIVSSFSSARTRAAPTVWRRATSPARARPATMAEVGP